ncbi:hypothetical protein BD414DRAFT_412345 [Trametes punicea]|nr:hypothetical protein BD414DRAFT_412345 [Trametes punicea]
MPVEIWKQVFSYLDRSDILNIARTSSYLGAIAETEIYANTRLTAKTFVLWTSAIHVPYRAEAVRKLHVSFEGMTGKRDLTYVTYRLAQALRQLPNLEHLSIVNLPRLPKTAVRDILRDCNFSLKSFFCDEDKLVLASWNSLETHSEITELRVLFDPTDEPPSGISPDTFQHLRLLDTGAPFASRATTRSTFTNLSVHVLRATAARVLQRITAVLGHQICAIRVVREISVPHSGSPVIPPALTPQDGVAGGTNTRFWESDSPLMLLAAIRAPRLVLFEVRDNSNNQWTLDGEALRDDPGVRDLFAPQVREKRTPALMVIIWRPVWAITKRDRRLTRGFAVDCARDFFTLMPLRQVAMPLIKDMPEREAEGWTVWENDAGTQGWNEARPPRQLHLHAPIGTVWETMKW